MYPYFQYVNIPNLKTIQEELWQNYDFIISSSSEYTKENDAKQSIGVLTVTLVKKDILLASSPALVKYLTDVNLLEKLQITALITAGPGSPEKVHTDGVYQNALNLPIHNCQDGFTLFYQPVEDRSVHVGKLTGAAIIENPGDVVTMSKVNSPHWINTFMPHKSLNNSNTNRYSLSLRFGKTWDTTIHLQTEFYEDNEDTKI